MKYPHGTILNRKSDSTHKKLPENIYFFGVPNILPEADPGRLCVICKKFFMKLIFGIIALILHFTSSEDLKMIFVWQDSK